MWRTLFQLPRSVWLLGLISLVNDSASELVYPLVPLYLSSVLMAGPRVLGLIEGLAEALASLLKLWAGVMADRSGTAKPWVVAGYGLAGAARPSIALVTGWPLLLALRLTDRAAKALRAAPRDALLAAGVAPGQRGLAFGLHRAMDNAGAVIGPLLAWALLAAGVPLGRVFLWAVVPGALCLVLTLALRDTPPPAAPPPAFSWRLAGLPAPLRRYLVVVTLFTLGNASNMFLLLRARELGVAEAQVPLLWAAVSAVAALFSVPLGGLSDRIGRMHLLVAGYVAYALFYVGMGWFAAPGWRLYALFGLYGVFMAATDGVERALMADLAPPGQRGTAFGWLNLVTGAVLLPASLLFGGLWEATSAQLAFGFSAACALAAAVLLRAWVEPALGRLRAARAAFVLEAAKAGRPWLEAADDGLLTDRRFLQQLIIAAPQAFQQLPAWVKSDAELSELAVHWHPANLTHLPVDFEVDRRAALAMLEKHRHVFEFMPESIRADRACALAALRLSPANLRHASAELQRDKALVIAAIQAETCLNTPCDRCTSLEFAAPELQQDPDVQEAARRSVQFKTGSQEASSNR